MVKEDKSLVCGTVSARETTPSDHERRPRYVDWPEAQAARPVNVVEPDPAWRAGATTLQGHSTQQFVTAEPIMVDPSRKVELVLRLVAREGEEVLEFPKDECKPLSTLIPPAVQE